MSELIKSLIIAICSIQSPTSSTAVDTIKAQEQCFQFYLDCEPGEIESEREQILWCIDHRYDPKEDK